MDFGRFGEEISEVFEGTVSIHDEFSKEALDKFDDLFDGDGIEGYGKVQMPEMSSQKGQEKYEELFAGDDVDRSGKSLDGYDEAFSGDIAPDQIPNKDHPVDILYADSSQDVSETKEYKDDNGKLYRIGNELLPNCQYEINGYKYETDDKGRIISAEGNLHLKDRDGRLPIADSIEDIGKGDQKEGDDRGHLIGDQFDGSNGLENMVPQDAEVNRNDFRNFENELAKEVKNGNEVYCKVEPVYSGDSRRPEAIVVTYSINGQENVRIFPNGKE
jgi:hypothetical protein